ncbi:BnaA02g05070D [Brassica napus]|uniref:Auxin response factor n=1 Tax=Brassica napus TaxID=3708 RepID=A0A078I6P4_BRANA|nr:BnaA02g05070D [Brassica napus]
MLTTSLININSELWHACAGPLISLPPAGSLVVYFPQGHSEQVAASMQKQTDFIPSYPNLPSKLICMLQNVTLNADPETDEVYAQMTLQPVNKYDRDALLASDMGLKLNRQPNEFFCKTLTASDTSTHGGFSVPRRAAEKIFPALDFSMQPPCQELVAKDIHDNTWTFRHIYRGQPKRHLLTTGWSVFVSNKRLFAGDSVLFIRDGKAQLLLGIRRANRQQPALSSSVISSDSMHIGVLAAAAHANANNSPFTIFYNPRAAPAEFVVPLAKYTKAMYAQVSLGMRFRMIFETEECGVRRYMGTVTGISDLDPVRWKSSQWRNLQIGWDESAAGDRPSRVSVWDIEPVLTPFYICPPPFFRPRFAGQPGMPDDETDMESALKRAMPWLDNGLEMKDSSSSIFPGLSLVQWMSMQQQNGQLPSSAAAAQSGFFPSMLPPATGMHNNLGGTDDPSKLLSFQTPPGGISSANLQFNKPNPQASMSQLPQPPTTLSQQQQPQQLLHSSLNHQQQQSQPQQQQTLQQQHHQPLHQQTQQLQQQQQQLQSHPHPQPQSHQQAAQQHQAQQASMHHLQPPVVSVSMASSVIVPPSSSLNQNCQQQQQQSTQLQHTHRHLGASTSQSNVVETSKSSSSNPMSIPPHDTQFPRQLEQQQPPVLVNGPNQQHKAQQTHQQMFQQSLLEQPHLQFQLLQRLQQQQQQFLMPGSSSLQSQLLHQQLQQPPPQMLVSRPQDKQNPLVGGGGVKAYSGITDGGDAPSSSTSPSTNNCQISSSTFLNRTQSGPPTLMPDAAVDISGSLVQDLYSKSDMRLKHELAGPQKSKASLTDHHHQLEASASGTSFLAPTFGLDSDSRNSLLAGANVDNGFVPDTLLSRGYDSQKDLQNMLSNYGGVTNDIGTEMSTSAIRTQSFGIPNVPAISNDVAVNDAGGVLGGGLWPTQTQRMRTYTKVQKRGSVGRSIDVNRYRGYDELRHDLARMFGIEGQLEDPQTSDWKLVYVDHENDILLVGDDPWEEFVNCVQSIKILSSAEVQQMSLDGNFAGVPVTNQACSGGDSGNAWRGHYDDNSATSFNRFPLDTVEYSLVKYLELSLYFTRRFYQFGMHVNGKRSPEHSVLVPVRLFNF